MMNWENFLKLVEILNTYEIEFSIGNYYDTNQKIIGHWLEINEQTIDIEIAKGEN